MKSQKVLIETFLSTDIENDPSAFFGAWKESGCAHFAGSTSDVSAIFMRSFSDAFAVGKASLPIALAVSMHLYMLGAIATYPLSFRNPMGIKRKLLLGGICKRQLIVANTGGRRTHSDTPQFHGTTVPDGLKINGKSAFMSLGHHADVVLVTAAINDHEKVACLVALDSNGITLDALPLDGSMRHSGTCSVKMESCIVEPTHFMLIPQGTSIGTFDTYQFAWFQSVIPAAYLGAAMRALEEAVKESQTVITKGGISLANIDGFRTEIGRLHARLKGAMEICLAVGTLLSSYNPNDEKSVERLHETSAVAKYFGTQIAEEAVLSLRSLLGTRAFENKLITKVSKEVLYGCAHPTTAFTLERYFADKLFNA